MKKAFDVRRGDVIRTKGMDRFGIEVVSVKPLGNIVQFRGRRLSNNLLTTVEVGWSQDVEVLK
jgi:hypothetical protein